MCFSETLCRARRVGAGRVGIDGPPRTVLKARSQVHAFGLECNRIATGYGWGETISPRKHRRGRVSGDGSILATVARVSGSGKSRARLRIGAIDAPEIDRRTRKS